MIDAYDVTSSPPPRPDHAPAPSPPSAGVMLEPRGETPDGFERHLGVNFLGHFLLTRLLLPKLRGSAHGVTREKGRGSRIVTVASATHYVGEMVMSDLQGR